MTTTTRDFCAWTWSARKLHWGVSWHFLSHVSVSTLPAASGRSRGVVEVVPEAFDVKTTDFAWLVLKCSQAWSYGRSRSSARRRVPSAAGMRAISVRTGRVAALKAAVCCSSISFRAHYRLHLRSNRPPSFMLATRPLTWAC